LIAIRAPPSNASLFYHESLIPLDPTIRVRALLPEHDNRQVEAVFFASRTPFTRPAAPFGLLLERLQVAALNQVGGAFALPNLIRREFAASDQLANPPMRHAYYVCRFKCCNHIV
jgi:hypothetical protein